MDNDTQDACDTIGLSRGNMDAFSQDDVNDFIDSLTQLSDVKTEAHNECEQAFRVQLRQAKHGLDAAIAAAGDLYVPDAMVFVMVRYLRDEVPEPQPGEDTPGYREAVADWYRIWDMNDMPPAYRDVRRRKRATSELRDPAADNLSLTDRRNILLLNAELAQGEPVRTSVAHFLEDYASLRWAASIGFPTYVLIYEIDVKTELACNINASRDDYLSWMVRTHVQPDMKFEGWMCNTVLALHTDGKPPSCHDYVVNVRIDVPGFLRKNGKVDVEVETSSVQSRRTTYPHDLMGGHPKYALPRRLGNWPPEAPFPLERGCDDYYNWRSWKAMAGRDVRWGFLYNLPAELMARWLAGWTGVFIKSIHCKRGTWLVRFPARGTPDVTPGRLFGLALDSGVDGGTAGPARFMSTGMESRHVTTPCYMLQELVNFRDEYRFFVVDGHIVAGTPVRRADNILASAEAGVREGKLRPFMCADRNSEGPVHDRKRVAEYARAARKIVMKIRNEYKAKLKDFVLDMGTNVDDGAIIPIEVNSLSCAGTYGMDPAVPYDALLRVLRRHAIDHTLQRLQNDERLCLTMDTLNDMLNAREQVEEWIRVRKLGNVQPSLIDRDNQG